MSRVAGTGATPVRPVFLGTARSKRYSFRQRVISNVNSGSRVFSIQCPIGAPVVRVYRIRVMLTHIGAGVGGPLDVRRTTTIAGGTLNAVSTMHKMDTTYADPQAQVRSGLVTSDAGSIAFISLGGDDQGAAGTVGPITEWLAVDAADMVVLRPNEGLVFETGTPPGDADDTWNISVHWEEEE